MMRRRSVAEAPEADASADVAGGADPEPEVEYRYRRSWFQRGIIAIGVLAVIACITTVAYIGYNWNKLDQIAREDINLAPSSDLEPQNWLIVGSDSRDVIAKNDPNAAVFTGGGEATGGQRSDTIMIVRIDPEGEQLEVLSLQRDLWLPIARTGESERINTAYTYPDGPQRLVDTIKTNFNIDINHYVEINFASFEGIVDAVGGLPMYFDKPMHDANSGLQIDNVGCVTLNGFQALAFSRARHLQYSDGLHWINDESSDLGRISRQQYFMRKMFDRVGARWKDPVVNFKLIDIATNNIGLDKQIEITKVIAMGERFATFKGDSIKTYTLPITPVTKPSGAQVLEVDMLASKAILSIFRGVPEGDSDPSSISLAVENGSGVAGQAAEVQKAFLALGYEASGAKDHGSSVATTEVRYAAGREKEADQIKRHLTNGAVLVADPALTKDQLVLVTGADFTTVMRRPRPLEPGTEPGTTSTSTSSTTSVKGAAASSVTSTTAPPYAINNDGTHMVGVVPGQPPDGVTCE